MSGAYRPGADAPEDAAEVLTPPPSAVPEKGPARPRRSRRRRRRPANPPDLADIADATGVRRPPAATPTAEPPAVDAPTVEVAAAEVAAVDPPAAEPVAPEPVAPEPVSAEPVSAEPVVTEPHAPEPVAESAPPVEVDAAVPADAPVAAAADAESVRPGAGAEVTPSTAESTADGKDEYDEDDDDDLASSVRPYSWTRGRTRSSHDLQLETLVSTTDHGRDMAALTSIEHRAVAELCESARSVAEVAALLDLPLGVARVVVGDMAGLGLVSVHGGSSGDAPDTALMERVLSGLRRL